MELVKNSKKYWEFIRQLRNKEGVKQGFIKQSNITVDEHAIFMDNYSDCFYICLNEKQPVGYIGVINNDIRVATEPNMQGKGVGSFMVKALVDRHPTAHAKVKIENEASLRLFEKCGFVKKYYILEKDETQSL